MGVVPINIRADIHRALAGVDPALKPIHWLVTLPSAVVLTVFAISNRETVELSFWPLPAILSAPLYLIILLLMLLGFLIGELVAWINGRHWRREARRQRDRADRLERELAAIQAGSPQAGSSPTDLARQAPAGMPALAAPSSRTRA
jgi:uncharacterized integral membrane protein